MQGNRSNVFDKKMYFIILSGSPVRGSGIFYVFLGERGRLQGRWELNLGLIRDIHPGNNMMQVV